MQHQILTSQQTHKQQEQQTVNIPNSQQSQIKNLIFKDQKTSIISSDHICNKQFEKLLQNQNQEEINQKIKIKINKTQKKTVSLINSYYVYIIEGSDDKGQFCIPRRFNQFYQMRSAMVQRWPGCFIPSIPAKNMIAKNDTQIVERRKRYLNQFVKQIVKLPHLYYGEEFQTLLRSVWPDLSQKYSKWPALSTESIINKYRINFSQLSGKQINNQRNEKVNNFIFFIRKNQIQLQKDRQNIKKLAESLDKYNLEYVSFFKNVFPVYQKVCLSEYCQKQTQMLYQNESQAKLHQHQTISKQIMKQNPYWLLYDVIRHQQRDGLAFLESIQARNKYQTKKKLLDIKMFQNSKNINQLSLGKKPIQLFHLNGSNDDIIKKLQKQNEQYRKQKENILLLIDVITALISYIQIQRYKEQKKYYYQKAIKKISFKEMIKIQNLDQIWSGLKKAVNQKIIIQ